MCGGVFPMDHIVPPKLSSNLLNVPSPMLSSSTPGNALSSDDYFDQFGQHFFNSVPSQATSIL